MKDKSSVCGLFRRNGAWILTGVMLVVALGLMAVGAIFIGKAYRNRQAAIITANCTCSETHTTFLNTTIGTTGAVSTTDSTRCRMATKVETASATTTAEIPNVYAFNDSVVHTLGILDTETCNACLPHPPSFRCFYSETDPHTVSPTTDGLEELQKGSALGGAMVMVMGAVLFVVAIVLMCLAHRHHKKRPLTTKCKNCSHYFKSSRRNGGAQLCRQCRHRKHPQQALTEGQQQLPLQEQAQHLQGPASISATVVQQHVAAAQGYQNIPAVGLTCVAMDEFPDAHQAPLLANHLGAELHNTTAVDILHEPRQANQQPTPQSPITSPDSIMLIPSSPVLGSQ